MNATLAAETDGKRTFLHAASTFEGYYLSNTRTRVKFCKEQGVDIARFVAAVDRVNAAERMRASEAEKDFPMNVDEFYAAIEPQMRKAVEIDMTDVSTRNHISMRQACQLISDNADAIAAQAAFARMQPVVHEALMGPY